MSKILTDTNYGLNQTNGNKGYTWTKVWCGAKNEYKQYKTPDAVSLI